MKCLSLKQPWAWAVINGLKDIENRKWKTKFRGELLIHASMNYELLGDIVIRENGVIPPERLALACGAIVGKVTVVDCVRLHPSKWFFGPWGFVLKDAVAFKRPIPYKGRLSFFEVPEQILYERG